MSDPRPTSLDDALLQARLALHDSSALGSAAASLAAGTALLLLMWHTVGWQVQWGLWWLGLVMALGVRLGLRQSWRARPAARSDEAWIRLFRLSVLLHGLVWATISGVLSGQDLVAVQYAAFIATAMTGGALINTAFDGVSSLLFALPAVLPLLLHLLSLDGPQAGALLVGTVVFLGIMLLAARRASAMFVDRVLASRAEQQRLLEAQRAASDAEAARRELADQHELLRQLLRGTSQGYWFVDTEGKTLEVNDAMVALLGRPRDEVMGRGVFDFFAGPEQAELERQLAARRQGVTGAYELDIVQPDGTRLHALNNATPIVDASGRPIGSIGLWTDLTAQKRQQDELRTYERVANSIDDMVAVIGADRCYRLVNDAWCRHAGLPREQVLSRPVRELPLQLSAADPMGMVEACFSSGTSTTITVDAPGRHGPLRLQTTCLPYREAAAAEPGGGAPGPDRVRSVILVTRDVTEQERTTMHLRHREAELQALFEAFPGYITAVDEDLRYAFINERAAAMLGYAAQAMIGRPVRQLLSEERWRSVMAELQRARAGEVVRAQHTYPGPERGRQLHVEITQLAGPPGPDGRRLYYSFGLDVTEHHAALAALAQARDDAERANDAKSRFLSHMSHELRTPLNAITGFAHLLQRDRRAPLPPHQGAWLGHILRGSQHLATLIGELLDLGRIEAGQLALQPEPVNLPELFDECLGFVAELARSHGVRLLPPVLPPPGALRPVRADRLRLKQVLLNLLSNAIKYNRPDGQVQLLARPQGGRMLLQVTDTGPGLTEAQKARLFQPFERLGAERGVVEGSGIGLLLCRHLVEAMSGRIGLDSEPGLGSTFWLHLPAAALPQVPATPAPDTVDGSASAGFAMTVLVVDDNPVNLELLQAVLEDEPGLQVVGTTQPLQAMDLARRHRPDVVLLDIHMPELDGHQLLACLRADDTLRTVPVVAVSADAAAAQIAAALAEGFDGYLTKPVDLQQMLDTVRQFRRG